MADALAQLLAQQQGIAYTPRENVYGQIGGTIAGALPKIVSPYASTGSNIATVLGGSLLAGLLGYQAKQEAAEKNQALIPAITGIMGATDVAGVNTQLGTFDPEVATRLAPIALQRMSALQEREAQQQAAQQKLAQDLLVKAVETGQLPGSALNIPGLENIRFPTVAQIAEQKALAEAQAELAAAQSPEGIALAEQKLENEIEKAERIAEAKANVMPVTTKQLIARQKTFAKELRRTAKEYGDMKLSGVVRKIAEYVPGTEPDITLGKLLNLVPGVTKALGQAGNLNEQEQQRVLRAMLGGAIPSGTDTIAQRLQNTAQQLENLSEDQINYFRAYGDEDSKEQFLNLFESTINNPTANLIGQAMSTPEQSENVQKRIQQIEAQLKIPNLDPNKKAMLETYLERLRNG
jgi:hypothetical protein